MNNDNYKQQLKYLKNKIKNKSVSILQNKNLNVIGSDKNEDSVLDIAFDASVDPFKMIDIIDIQLDNIKIEN